MFKCGICEKSSKPGETSQSVVTGVRERVYSCMVRDEHAKPGFRKLIPAERPGHEIVSQALACTSCASKAKTVMSKRGNPILSLA